MAMLYGLHGTAHAAAERILATGWDPAAASAHATPRLLTGPECVYAYWGADLPALIAARRWAVEQWAVEAVERHGAARPYRGAVLLLRVAEADLHWAVEPIAQAAAIIADRILATGEEPPHGHPWNGPWTERRTESGQPCEACWRAPELVWRWA